LISLTFSHDKCTSNLISLHHTYFSLSMDEPPPAAITFLLFYLFYEHQGLLFFNFQ
jgi:hypothetical protein